MSKKSLDRVQHAVRTGCSFALMTAVIFAILAVLAHFAPQPSAASQDVQFLQPAAVSTDTPPAATDTPVPPTPTPLPTATPQPTTVLVFDSGGGSSQHSLDSTAYYLSLRFHTQPAMPGDDVFYGATACGAALFSTTGSHLDASGAQTFTTTFHASCPEPFNVTVSAQFLSSGSNTYPLSGSTTFTVTN